jgi:cation:H+ antiporter
MGLLPRRNLYPVFFLFLFFAEPIQQTGPSAFLWTAPAILLSSLMVAWAAESAQFFMAQAFALAILAWMQTLPEFAVEAVFAWRQQSSLLLASLTGALRLLTGFGWPVIYFTAAFFHRRRSHTPLRAIHLDEHHSVEVVGLLVPLLYIVVVAAKGTLTLLDSAILIGIYAAYLIILSKLPPEDPDSIEELEIVPRTIVRAPRFLRITIIFVLFGTGAVVIKYATEPFVGSLLAIAATLGMSNFRFVQLVTPLVSEFPEMASTFYFARTVDQAPMALMNMASSNINQWTLVVGMLPIVYSISLGSISTITLTSQQRLEVLMTLGQALAGMMFLINMELAWWEASALFVLFFVPYAYAAAAPAVTVLYFVWAAFEVVRILSGRRQATALLLFAKTWNMYVRPVSRIT